MDMPTDRTNTTEATRAVALAFFDKMDDPVALDAMLAPDADWWTQPAGPMDRSTFVAVHKPFLDRPAPSSRVKRLLGLTVQGDRAAVEMEWEVVWPDITYHQFYHHVLIVRDGLIRSMREYCDPYEATKLYAVLLGSETSPSLPSPETRTLG